MKKECAYRKPLFKPGEFLLSSGAETFFKIECANLTGGDWACIAEALALILPSRFGRVIGVPSEGLKLAYSISTMITKGEPTVLICADVLTTGATMEAYKRLIYPGVPVIGCVAFARGKCPDWITPFMTLHPDLCEHTKCPQ